jgi:hypothetical protein
MGYAGQALKDGFNTPEASAAENCCLFLSHDDWMLMGLRSSYFQWLRPNGFLSYHPH